MGPDTTLVPGNSGMIYLVSIKRLYSKYGVIVGSHLHFFPQIDLLVVWSSYGSMRHASHGRHPSL